MYEAYGDQLKTDNIKDFLPDVFVEYGSRPIDIQVTMSHDLINKIVPKTKVSGVVFDIRTCFEIVLNFYVKLMV